MNHCFLKHKFQEKGFALEYDMNGNEVPIESENLEKEYRTVREKVGITDLSYVKIHHVAGDDAVDFLDYIICGDVAGLKEEEILHSCIVDHKGKIISDVYLANDDDEFFLLSDGGDYQQLNTIIVNNSSEYDITISEKNDEYALFSVDGPYSWITMKSVFSSEILGIGYLDFMKCEDKEDTYVFRAGKTGEYGYWIMIPKQNGLEVFNEIVSASSDHRISLYGLNAARLFRMENHMFHYKESEFVANPYEIGLFWQVFNDKEMHTGTLLQNALDKGIKRWVAGFETESTDTSFDVGDPVMKNGESIGIVINKGYSYSLKKTIGRAILNKQDAYPDFVFSIGDGKMKTASMPFIMNKSLSVKPE